MDGDTLRNIRRRLSKRRGVVGWILVFLVFFGGASLATLIITNVIAPAPAFESSRVSLRVPPDRPATIAVATGRRSTADAPTTRAPAPVTTTLLTAQHMSSHDKTSGQTTAESTAVTWTTVADWPPSTTSPASIHSTSPSTPTSAAAVASETSDSVSTSSGTATPTCISSASPMSTSTALATLTNSATAKLTSEVMSTSTSVAIPISTSAAMPTSTSAAMPTSTSALTSALTSTGIPTSMGTATPTLTSTATPTSTSTAMPTSTSTAMAVSTSSATAASSSSTTAASSSAATLPSTSPAQPLIRIDASQPNRLTAHIAGGLQPGTTLRYCGTLWLNASRFVIDIQSSGQNLNTHLHVTGRFDIASYSLMIFNSKINGYYPHRTERSVRSPSGLERGRPIELLFRVTSANLKIYMNGVHLLDYPNHLASHVADEVIVSGTVQTHAIDLFTTPSDDAVVLACAGTA